MFTTILTVINIIALIAIVIGFFLSRYTIVDLETWNEIAHFYNENKESEQDVNEAAGGVGFFWDYVSDLEVEEEEEPEEDE